MYSIGDSVLIRPDLKVGNIYGGFGFVNGMESYLGKVMKVAKIVHRTDNDNHHYKLASYDNGTMDVRCGWCGWNWTEEMLLPCPQLDSEDEFEESDLPIDFLFEDA